MGDSAEEGIFARAPGRGAADFGWSGRGSGILRVFGEFFSLGCVDGIGHLLKAPGNFKLPMRTRPLPQKAGSPNN